MPEMLYALGKAALNLEPAQAENALSRVIELEKQTLLAGQAYQGLATLHRKQGKTELASQELKEFQRIQSLVQPERAAYESAVKREPGAVEPCHRVEASTSARI
jgi:hypothetical protein